MKTILGILIEYVFIMIFLFTGNFLLFIPICFCMPLVVDGITGNFVKKSCFMITKEITIKFQKRKMKVDMIEGNPCRFFKTLKLSLKKDKTNNFVNEAYNLFKQLPQTRNNEIITYACVSHAYTYNLLKKLKENGYINRLEYEEKNKSRLITEELAMGKIPTFKERQMKSIIFTLTSKKITDDDFKRIMIKKYNRHKIQNTEIKNSKSEIIDELRNMKEELILTKNLLESSSLEQEKVKTLKKRCKF